MANRILAKLFYSEREKLTEYQKALSTKSIYLLYDLPYRLVPSLRSMTNKDGAELQ